MELPGCIDHIELIVPAQFQTLVAFFQVAAINCTAAHGSSRLLCAFGGAATWMVYLVAFEISGNDLSAYFWSSLFASAYSEIMARIRKYPAISYLVVSIFPLIPGAGVYYTMNYAVRGMNEQFALQGLHTAAIAGTIAVGILLASTVVRMYLTWRGQKKK